MAPCGRGGPRSWRLLAKPGARADREALLLRYWYDLSSGESAKVLGCTAATFAVRLHRARRRFKKLYEAHSIDTHLVPDSSLTAYMRGLQ